MIISKSKVTNLKIPGDLFSTYILNFPSLDFFLSIVIPDVRFRKLEIMIEHIKIMQIPHLDYGQCFFLNNCLNKQQFKSLVL